MLAVRTTIHVSVCSFIWKRYWSFVGICIFILFMFILLYWISVFRFSADDTIYMLPLQVDSFYFALFFRSCIDCCTTNDWGYSWITYCLMFCFKSFGVTYIPLSPGQLIYIKINILYMGILWVIHRTVWQLMYKLQLCLL